MISANELRKVLHVSKKEVQEIDKGMWDILYELNRKGYTTTFCCEGHPKEGKRWGAYLCFIRSTTPSVLPPLYHVRQKYENMGIKRYSKYTNNSFYWWGTDSKKYTLEDKEKERQELLEQLLEWAKGLELRKV